MVEVLTGGDAAFTRRITACSVAFALVTGASLSGLAESAPPPAHAPTTHHAVAPASIYAHALPPLNLTECPAPSEQSLSNAGILEGAPNNPYIQVASKQEQDEVSTAIYTTIESDIARHEHLKGGIQALTNYAIGSYDRAHSSSYQDTKYWYLRNHVAKETGVTVYDPREYLNPLKADLDGANELPGSTYLATAQAYLGLFGVRLDLADADPGAANLPDDMIVPTLDELNNKTVKQDFIDLIESFASMPQQYIDLANTKYVYIAINADPNKGAGAAAYTAVNGPHNLVVMNFGYDDDETVFMHETMHDVAAAVCGGVGGMYNDPSVSSFNSHPYDSKDKGLTYQNFWTSQDVEQLSTQVQNAFDNNQTAAAQALEGQIDQKLADISYPTQYSQTDVAEDEAETGKPMSSGNWIFSLSKWTPLIKDKFTVLLARVDNYLPGVAEYFSMTSEKSDGYK